MSNVSLTKNTPSDREYELYDGPSTAYELDFVLLIDTDRTSYGFSELYQAKSR